MVFHWWGRTMLNLPFSLVVYLFIIIYYLMLVWIQCLLRCVFSVAFSFFFFFFWHAIKKIVRLLFMHCSWTVAALFDFSTIFSTSVGPMNSAWIQKSHFLAIFSLKMGLTILFTHLKIILLQCFQQNKFYLNGPLMSILLIMRTR